MVCMCARACVIIHIYRYIIHNIHVCVYGGSLRNLGMEERGGG